MVNPQVKAAYQFNPYGTVYIAFDLSQYDNDVKDYARLLQLYRTDTNTLIRSTTLGAGDYTSATIIGEHDLGIRAVLTIDGEIVSTDEIEFVSAPVQLDLVNAVSVTKTGTGFKIVNNSGLSLDDYVAFAFLLRRNTSDAQLNKLEYTRPITDFLEFTYFNEMVVSGYVYFFDRVTHQVINGNDAAFVNQNALLDPYYNGGGIYTGTPNKDPLGDEDAEPDYSMLDDQDPITTALAGDFFHPHTLNWTTLAGEATEDDDGYPVPGTEGVAKQSPCRFHPKSNKMIKNEDSTESLQVGKIRIPLGADVPHQWASVQVMDSDGGIVYEGLAKTRNVGQLSGGWIEV